MAGLCRILMAATLVVHLTVGCCWHHAHACEGKDCSRPAHGDAPHDGRCPESGGDHSHHGANDCHGAKCSFVIPSRAVCDSFVRPFQASISVLVDAQPSPAGFGPEQHALFSGWLLLPVRLHLANQVLLI
jgi:hypothetical protein